MISKRAMVTTLRIFEIPKHVVARAIMGIFMTLVGVSYIYSSLSGCAAQSAVLNRFIVYGPDAPEIVAWLYIICGTIMLVFIQKDFVIRAVLPNFLYVGMLFQLVLHGDASWSAFLTTGGLTVISTIAVMRGAPPSPQEGSK